MLHLQILKRPSVLDVIYNRYLPSPLPYSSPTGTVRVLVLTLNQAPDTHGFKLQMSPFAAHCHHSSRYYSALQSSVSVPDLRDYLSLTQLHRVPQLLKLLVHIFATITNPHVPAQCPRQHLKHSLGLNRK